MKLVCFAIHSANSLTLFMRQTDRWDRVCVWVCGYACKLSLWQLSSHLASPYLLNFTLAGELTYSILATHHGFSHIHISISKCSMFYITRRISKAHNERAKMSKYNFHEIILLTIIIRRIYQLLHLFWLLVIACFERQQSTRKAAYTNYFTAQRTTYY